MAPIAIYYGEQEAGRGNFVHAGSSEPAIVDSGQTRVVEYSEPGVMSFKIEATDSRPDNATETVKLETQTFRDPKRSETLSPLPLLGLGHVVRDERGREIGFAMKPVSSDEASRIRSGH